MGPRLGLRYTMITKMKHTILHLDLDAFFCAVEETRNPQLRGKAFAVAGRPNERGVVASCSYPARRTGVRSAMPTARALRLCPDLIIVPGRHRLYSEISEKVMDRLHNLTPLVEQISIDEAFLDITDLPEPPERIARRLQAAIRDELSLPSSIGIASNKLVAKIATEVGKKSAKGDAAPFALTIVPAGQEAAFLAPLPAAMLWGVGPKTEARLASFGIHTIGDIARWPTEDLIRRFGEHGRDLSLRANGVGDLAIVTEHGIKSISQETTFSRDVQDEKVLAKTLREQAAQIGARLRKNDLAGTTVKLKIRWPDFTTLTRQTTLPHSTDNDDEIFTTAHKLLKRVRKPGQAVRLIGVGVSGLGAPIRQLGLWDSGSEKASRLQQAVDKLREKYGNQIIQHGGLP
jgi:DNA polymerase-4